MKSDLSPPSRPEVLADALSLGADTDAFASIVAEMRRAASLVPPASDIKAMEMGDYPSFLGSNRSLARSHAQSVCEIAERNGLDPLQFYFMSAPRSLRSIRSRRANSTLRGTASVLGECRREGAT